MTSGSLFAVLIGFLIFVGILLLFREVITWFWKINEITTNQKKRTELLTTQTELLTNLLGHQETQTQLLRILADQQRTEIASLQLATLQSPPTSTARREDSYEADLDKQLNE